MPRHFAPFALFALLISCGAPPMSGFTNVSTQICPSGQQWAGGNRESDLMQPGVDCVECHTRMREGPHFSIAGTVYADLNISNGCGGTSGPQVVITGADGKVSTLTANEAGNFFSTAAVALPFTAKVISSAGERAMVAPQTVGSCNSCHTETGSQSAPGRIMAP